MASGRGGETFYSYATAFATANFHIFLWEEGERNFKLCLIVHLGESILNTQSVSDKNFSALGSCEQSAAPGAIGYSSTKQTNPKTNIGGSHYENYLALKLQLLVRVGFSASTGSGLTRSVSLRQLCPVANLYWPH